MRVKHQQDQIADDAGQRMKLRKLYKAGRVLQAGCPLCCGRRRCRISFSETHSKKRLRDTPT